jgi:hypothetical protein
MQLDIRFIGNDGTKPKSVLAAAEVVFIDPESPLHGTKLVGFTVRRSDSGGVYVTLPSRAFGIGNDRRYFDLLRAASDDHDTARETVIRVKTWIRNAFKDWQREGARGED